jgi:RNA polymerase sigma-70 factor (ECF subfamily)
MTCGKSDTPESRKTPAFPATRWSLIVSLGDVDERSAEKALAELCQLYWYPVYAFIRRSGGSPEDAEDLTQDFFANVIRRGDFEKVGHRPSARFRSYVLASVKNLMAADYRKRTTKSRGNRAEILSIDAKLGEKQFQNEPVEFLTPEGLFERRWAITLIDAALQELREEYHRTDRGDLFESLQPLIPLKHDSGQYEEATNRLDMTRSALQVAMHRLRKRYQSKIREQIAHTVSRDEEIEDELRYIFGLFVES